MQNVVSCRKVLFMWERHYSDLRIAFLPGVTTKQRIFNLLLFLKREFHKALCFLHERWLCSIYFSSITATSSFESGDSTKNDFVGAVDDVFNDLILSFWTFDHNWSYQAVEIICQVVCAVMESLHSNILIWYVSPYLSNIFQ